MPDYTSIFEAVGAYARACKHLRRIARADVEASPVPGEFRSLPNLARRFALVPDSAPGNPLLLAAAEHLTRLGTQLETAWPALKAQLDDYLVTRVAPELGTGGTAGEIVAALARAMAADGESLQGNVTSVTAPQAADTNAGTGLCYATIKVAAANDTLVDSQLVVPQGVEVICDADAPNDGTGIGRERWRVRGSAGLSGETTTIPVTAGEDEDNRNFVIDGSFTAFSGGTFTHFDATGEDLFSQETADTLFDGAALKVDAGGSGAASLSQTLSDRDSPPAGGALVALGVHAKVISIGAGTLTVRLVADGTPLTGAIVLNTSTDTGEWAHHAAFALLPRAAWPNELKVEIAASADFDGEVLLDGLSVANAEYQGVGLSLAIFQGVEPFVRAPQPDRFTLMLENDEPYEFVKFFRDVYAVEFPVSGMGTVDDALAG